MEGKFIAHVPTYETRRMLAMNGLYYFINIEKINVAGQGGRNAEEEFLKGWEIENNKKIISKDIGKDVLYKDQKWKVTFHGTIEATSTEEYEKIIATKKPMIGNHQLSGVVKDFFEKINLITTSLSTQNDSRE